jgi:hypothetical protein
MDSMKKYHLRYTSVSGTMKAEHNDEERRTQRRALSRLAGKDGQNHGGTA